MRCPDYESSSSSSEADESPREISSWHVLSSFSASFSPIPHPFGSAPYQLLFEATRHFALFNVSQSLHSRARKKEGINFEG